MGQAFSLIGSALVRFALIWWLTKKANSPFVLTTATTVSILPFIFLSPFAGALVDRWDRRRVMIIADILIALVTILMAYLYWRGVAQIWHVYAVLFLRSMGDVFQSPAMNAATSLLVPKSQLARVGAMNETLQGVTNIVSPMLGALTLELLQMQGTLALDVVTAVLAIIPLLIFSIPALPQSKASAAGAPKTSFLHEIVEGFRYIGQRRGLLFMFIAIAALRFFMIPAFSLLPLMVTNHFNGDILEMGAINMAYGFGFLIGGLVLGVTGGFKRRTMTALLGFIGAGTTSVIFGLLPPQAFTLGIVVIFVRMATTPFIRGSILAIFQAHIPPAIQGRTFTILLSSISLIAPLGLWLGGLIAEAYGVPIVFIGGGLGCLLIAVIWISNPAIMNLEAALAKEEASQQEKA